jgi:hypothetical protein
MYAKLKDFETDDSARSPRISAGDNLISYVEYNKSMLEGLRLELAILNNALEYYNNKDLAHKYSFDLWSKRQVMYFLIHFKVQLDPDLNISSTYPLYSKYPASYPTVFLKNFFNPEQVHAEVIENKFFVQLEICFYKNLLSYFKNSELVKETFDNLHSLTVDEIHERYKKINEELSSVCKGHYKDKAEHYTHIKKYHASRVNDYSDFYVMDGYLNILDINNWYYQLEYEKNIRCLPSVPLSNVIGLDNKYNYAYNYKHFWEFSDEYYFSKNYLNTMHKILAIAYADPDKAFKNILPYSHSVGLNYAYHFSNIKLLSQDTNYYSLKYIAECIFSKESYNLKYIAESILNKECYNSSSYKNDYQDYSKKICYNDEKLGKTLLSVFDYITLDDVHKAFPRRKYPGTYTLGLQKRIT